MPDKPKDETKEVADDVTLGDLPRLGAKFAEQTMLAYLEKLPSVMSPRYMVLQYIVVIFGSEILSSFGEKMLIEEGLSKDKVRALRTAIRNAIAKKNDVELAELKRLLN